MIFNVSGEVFRKPKIITSAELSTISSWVESEIDKYIKSGNTEFGIKDLFGGENYYWGDNNFPIQTLFTKYHNKYISEGYTDKGATDEAVKQAGIYVGWIIKSVCRNTKLYTFEIKREFRQIIYKVVCSGTNNSQDKKYA